MRARAARLAGHSTLTAGYIRSDQRQWFPRRRTGRVGTSRGGWWPGRVTTALEGGYLTATEGYILLEGRRPALPVRIGAAGASQRAGEVRSWALDPGAELDGVTLTHARAGVRRP